jgi:hypothetical protein
MSLKIREDLTIQTVGDEALILDLKSGQIHQLNTTAAWILAKCSGDNSIETIILDFAEYFFIDVKSAETDVIATIEQLNRLNIFDRNENNSACRP